MPKQTFYNLPTDKQERITNAAKSVFSKSHYSKVTIDQVVQTAGIPKGSFYQYFSNKDDLFLYLFHQIGDQKYDVLMAAIEEYSDLSFDLLMTKVLQSASHFENMDEEMIGLKQRFLVECPQKVKQQILSDVMPQTIELFDGLLQLFIDRGDFKADTDKKLISFLLTSSLFNLERYDLADGETHHDVFLALCNHIVEPLRTNK